MKLTIFGTGYVGLVTGACLAEVGHNVLCVDIDQHKIDGLNQGRLPIWEPGLEAIVARNVAEHRLAFTTDIVEGVAQATVQIIAVGTPPDEDGSADLQYVLAVAENIARQMDGYRVLINKSTVPVGTADQVRERVAAVLRERGARIRRGVESGISKGRCRGGRLPKAGPDHRGHRLGARAGADARALRALQPQP